MHSSRRRSSRRIAIASVATLIVLAVVPAAEAATKVVYAGPPGRPPIGADFNAFFRTNVTVKTGDSVRWLFHGFHTVTFRPRAFVVPGAPITGAFDAAGNPFWFNGQPSLTLPPNVAGRGGTSTVTRTSGYHNSGLPLSARPLVYTLRFPQAGTYRYVCVVHPGMSGTVTVRRRGGLPVPSAAADRIARALQVAGYTGITRARTRYTPPGGVVTAGHDFGAVAFFRFFPRVKTINAGQTVRFLMAAPREVHTVTFGPPALLASLERNILLPPPPTFSLHPQVFYPSDPPPLPPYTGANHGNGFLNSGQLDNVPGPPAPSSVSIRFDSRGTFNYVCIVHPGMAGQIRVV